MNDSKYEWYLEQRRDYAKTSYDQLGRFERTLLVSAGGAFGVLATGVLVASLAIDIFYLGAAFLLCLSYLATMLSHYFSHAYHEKLISALDESFELDSEFVMPEVWYAVWINRLNLGALVLLVLGCAMIAVWVANTEIFDG